jgi:hypothetical protein
MAEAGVLCVNADVVKKAGLYANATASAEAFTNVFIKEAEGFICAQSRYDWVTNYASVSTIGKEFLRDAVSSLSAMDVINYDAEGFISTEAQVMLDILWNKVVESVNILRDDNVRSFILNGT